MSNHSHEKTCPNLPKDTFGAIELLMLRTVLQIILGTPPLTPRTRVEPNII
ncbi:hypothetical protein QUF82_03770 [Thiotrichales bacterium HSG14]|nr:hypothetical protein [Thiotrichales bacterium HSG14]